jgi:hypothetical protein
VDGDGPHRSRVKRIMKTVSIIVTFNENNSILRQFVKHSLAISLDS